MIGDVLVSSILCNNLKKAWPDSEVHYMIYAHTTPVLDGNPNIDKQVIFTDEYRKSKRALFRFILSLRDENYDIVIDAYSKLESWLTVLLSNAPRKISYRKPGRSFLYTDTVERKKKPETNLGLIIEERLSLLEPLNLGIDYDPVPKLFVSDTEKAAADALFKEHGVDPNKKTVMISIIGSEKSKTYPPAYMAKVIDTIADHHDVNILFNYIPSQREQALEIYNLCGETAKAHIYFDLLGTDLRSFIAIMNKCDLIVGNDGGAINMAKALGKATFIIFSPWIPKEVWATFEDGITHKSVHLKDYMPEKFREKEGKKIKDQSAALYQLFQPEMFRETLLEFLSRNLDKKRSK